ncbi:OmpA family protein [Roseococcus sp. YIM B11640]|uniref:OmpA family protein n=1 Tax=Roseococcus sp. YIM B11640 TaxID=3133973 RepID=UPI003C7E33D8
MNRRLMLAAVALPLLAGCTTIDALMNPDPASQPARVVFFTEDSPTLDETGRATVRGAAEVARAYPSARVNVFGYAGPVGGVAFNRVLSEQRAQYVAQLLRENGVAADRVFVVPRGPVPFDQAPIESRRVEIRMAAQ